MNITTVALAHCPDYSSIPVAAAVQRVFSLCGSADAIIKPNARVLIKPNLIAPDGIASGATTHPAVIEAVIKIVHDCGAQAFIGDSPAFGSAAGVARNLGLDGIAGRYGVPIVEFKSNKNIIRQARPEQTFLGGVPRAWQRKIKRLAKITPAVNEYDCIISVPKLKAHVQMMFTGATKNVYGFISGKAKALRHFLVHNDVELFSLAILSMHARVQPDFTIIDAIDVMEERGPRRGVVNRRSILVGGKDTLAIDTVLCARMGRLIEDIPLLRYARTYNYGTTAIDEITVVGDTDIDLHDFKLPTQLIPISFSFKTVVRSIVYHCYTLWQEKQADQPDYL